MTSNLDSTLTALLSELGVERTGTRSKVTEAAEKELVQRGHDATVAELRYGVLTLETTTVGAGLLRYDTDNILKVLQVDSPGVVQSIRVRVRRR